MAEATTETLANEAGATTTELETAAPREPTAAERRVAELEADLKDERRRARDQDERLARLEGRLDERARPAPTAGTPVDDAAEDARFFESPHRRVRATAEQVADARFDAREDAAFRARCEVSAQDQIEELGEEGWREVERDFAALVGREPRLGALLRAAPDPARFARKQIEKRKVSGSARAQLAALEAENAELRKQVEGRGGVPVRKTLPATNAGARSAGDLTVAAPTKDAAVLLREILGKDD
jgi:hypothetical protein